MGVLCASAATTGRAAAGTTGETLRYHVIAMQSTPANLPSRLRGYLGAACRGDRCSSELINRIQLDVEFDRSCGTFGHFFSLFFCLSDTLDWVP